MSKSAFEIGNVEVGLDSPLFVIAGPCVIEDADTCLAIADKLVQIGAATGVPIVFKASFDKANRSSISSFRGPGLKKGLQILQRVKKHTHLAVTTDVHEPAQAEDVARVVDCLQIPAFLCRQTDILLACAKTGKPVNVKKGQFLSPMEMKNVVEKINSVGNEKILFTERGTFFGYNRLVNDMTAISVMKQIGYPVVFDATHSTQQPAELGNVSGGVRQMAPVLARAAVAAGANGLFIEVHTDPENAKSDAACVMPIEWFKELLTTCKGIFELVNRNRYDSSHPV
ncbi:MAG TPA: 3-deoxy-8-phosphooctulonate synthase [Planctomycetes bacterium]|nr:3-deoxy-8-phosphooctulonate synthase [Planctomycetota bacterium]